MEIYRNNRGPQSQIGACGHNHLYDLYTLHKLIMKLYAWFYSYLIFMYYYCLCPSPIPHEVLTCHETIRQFYQFKLILLATQDNGVPVKMFIQKLFDDATS